MTRSMIQGNEGVASGRHVFRPPYRNAMALFFAAFAVLFLYATVSLSKNNALAGVLALFCFVSTYAAWRRGLYAEAAGVRIVRPWRLHALRVEWRDIDRFEARSGAGQFPVTLIRVSDQRAIAIPTFPRPRKAIDPSVNPRYKGLCAKVQAQVDELNLLREQHSSPSVSDMSISASDPS